MNGRGVFRIHENARIVVLPTCPRCNLIAPRCLCGHRHPPTEVPRISESDNPRTREEN